MRECVCVHGSILEERCVCVALGKEGSCSLTVEHHDTPRILSFHRTVRFFKESEGGYQVFLFFLTSSGTRLIIHKHYWLCKGFCLGVLQGLLSAVTSASGLFLRPTPLP